MRPTPFTSRSTIQIATLLICALSLVSCGGDSDPVTPPDSNHAPGTPAINAAAGAPANNEVDVPLDAVLRWTCSDQDGDDLFYTVSFGTEASPPTVSVGQVATLLTPAAMANATTYYWKIVAKDSEGATTSSPLWSFTTVAASGSNHAPGTPTIDTAAGAPANDAVDVPLDAVLHWTCTDQDGDDLFYTVSFGTTVAPPTVSVGQVATSLTPAAMANGTTYYWKIVAEDSEGATTSSSVWSFTTVAAGAEETVSAPDAPVGPATGDVSSTIRYDVGGATSSLGHDIAYRFDWGNGVITAWGTSGWGATQFSAAGSYEVKAQARCTDHPSIESVWSAATTVVISEVNETLTTPSLRNPPLVGGVGDEIEFQTYGSSSSLGHTIEYQFSWGDGTYSAWGPISGNDYTASHHWSIARTASVRSHSRCTEHPMIVSEWSAISEIVISDTETVTAPVMPDTELTYDQGYITAFGFEASESNMGHELEYEVDWGNGTTRDWGTSTYVSVPTDVVGDFGARARARCIEHPDIVSPWSNTWLYHVVD